MNDIELKSKIPPLAPTADELRSERLADMPFLAAIKLLQGTSPEISDKKNKQGDFYLPTKDLNLSNEVEIVVCGRRPHALLLKDKTKQKESFNVGSPIYREIQRTPDDRPNGIVAFHGVGDWLLYLPAHALFCTYFCGRPSSRSLTDSILDFITPPDTRPPAAKDNPHTDHFVLYSHFETKKWGDKYRSFVPKVRPLPVFDGSEVTEDSYKRAQAIFYMPVLAEEEVIEQEEEEGDIDR